MLAHEIKNPLTPIEVLVTSLTKVFQGKSPQEFLAHLDETQRMVGEELQHLKATVNRFSEFARLPQVELLRVDLAEVIARQIKALTEFTSRADVELRTSAADSGARRMPRCSARYCPICFAMASKPILIDGSTSSSRPKAGALRASPCA